MSRGLKIYSVASEGPNRRKLRCGPIYRLYFFCFSFLYQFIAIAAVWVNLRVFVGDQYMT